MRIIQEQYNFKEKLKKNHFKLIGDYKVYTITMSPVHRKKIFMKYEAQKSINDKEKLGKIFDEV
jgi:hypothetical protein